MRMRAMEVKRGTESIREKETLPLLKCMKTAVNCPCGKLATENIHATNAAPNIVSRSNSISSPLPFHLHLSPSPPSLNPQPLQTPQNSYAHEQNKKRVQRFCKTTQNPLRNEAEAVESKIPNLDPRTDGRPARSRIVQCGVLKLRRALAVVGEYWSRRRDVKGVGSVGSVGKEV